MNKNKKIIKKDFKKNFLEKIIIRFLFIIKYINSLNKIIL